MRKRNIKKHLVFDLDNTLIMRNQAMVVCIEKLFGLYLSDFQKENIHRQDGEGHSDRKTFCKWLKSFLNIDLHEEIIWKLISDNIGNYVCLNSYAKDTLVFLKKEYELTLLTNGGGENQKRKIEHTGLTKFFPKGRIFISGEIGYSKPDQRIFQFVEDQLGKENQYCMIGDHFENDIIGAKKYGWQTIYLSPEEKYSIKNDVVYIPSLSKLNKALNELEY